MRDGQIAGGVCGAQGVASSVLDAGGADGELIASQSQGGEGQLHRGIVAAELNVGRANRAVGAAELLDTGMILTSLETPIHR